MLALDFNSLPLENQVMSSRWADSRAPSPCHFPVFVQVLPGKALIWCVPCQGIEKDRQMYISTPSQDLARYTLLAKAKPQGTKNVIIFLSSWKSNNVTLGNSKILWLFVFFFLNAFEMFILLKGFLIIYLIAWNKIHYPSNTVIVIGYFQGGIIWTNVTLSFLNMLVNSVFKKYLILQ